MREHGILFTTPNVQAILAGRKDVTRRIVDKEAEGDIWKRRQAFDVHEETDVVKVKRHAFKSSDPVHAKVLALWSPYGVPGDQLYVRETWTDLTYRVLGKDYKGPLGYAGYRADGAVLAWAEDEDSRVLSDEEKAKLDINWETVLWRPPRFMPRWAARLLLEVVSVRVERLQEITNNDAVREGCEATIATPNAMPREVFEHLWNEINGETAPWDCNPLVWRIEFRRLP